MRPAILNLKLIGLIVLFTMMLSCNNSNDEKLCLNYSTKIFETKISYYLKTINNYNVNNPADPKGIEIKSQADTFYKYYIECKELVNLAISDKQRIECLNDFHKKTRNYFIKYYNYRKNCTNFIDTLHTSFFSSKEAINNICAIEMYYVVNELRYYLGPDTGLYIDTWYYSYYPMSDSVKINDLYTSLIFYGKGSRRNINFDKYKIESIKRNGVRINESDIQIQFKDNKFLARADKAGKYEIILNLGSDVEYSKMNNKGSLQIEFVVIE